MSDSGNLIVIIFIWFMFMFAMDGNTIVTHTCDKCGIEEPHGGKCKYCGGRLRMGYG